HSRASGNPGPLARNCGPGSPLARGRADNDLCSLIFAEHMLFTVGRCQVRSSRLEARGLRTRRACRKFSGESTMGYKVGVVGATGNVGREMLGILAERSFPADEVVALASRRSQGIEVSYGDETLKVKALEHYDFSDVDICLMSAGAAVSKEWSPKITRAGAVVIDNSSCWRYDADVPLVVPEVNADAVDGFRKKGIIANPNCSTAPLVLVLKPLHDKATITRLVVAT